MKKIRNIPKYTRKAIDIVQNEGVLNLGIKSLQKIQKVTSKTSQNPARKRKFISLVDRKSVMDADWSTHPYQAAKTEKTTNVINWVMSPPRSGGGHQNIFRFIDFLDAAGYTNNVYLYSTLDHMTPAEAKENVASYSKAANTTFYTYSSSRAMQQADILFATGWETAYPVFNEKTTAQKLYFIQDFEPYFYPMGTDYILAENTYRFGYHGITAGGWLSKKLSSEYGMQTDHYDFGADKTNYRFENQGERKKIFFYARPVTERRGFDLGVMVLELFHQQRPDYDIVMAGWDVSDFDVPFPYTNHKSLPLNELSDVYNECAAALVISLTNMSLLPLELLACGTIPVVNEGENNRLVSDNPYIAYTQASPKAMADALVAIVDRKDAGDYAEKAARSVDGADWNIAGEKFLNIIQKVVKS